MLLFIPGSVVFGQDTSVSLPLPEILKMLEDRFDVVFSFADDNVQSVAVPPPGNALGLDECLTYLSGTTGLTFERLDSRFVTISKAPAVIEWGLCGWLVDEQTGEPVAAATIRHPGGVSIADDEGFFEVAGKKGRIRVAIQHVGYFPQVVEMHPVSADSCLRIGLTGRPLQLQEVFVSNYLVRGVDKRLDGSFEVKTGALQVLPGLSEPDVLYTMQALPGIQSPNESVSDINIRGGTNDQSLIRWDGIKMYQSSHFYGLITAFNPYFTEKVVLTKNGSSAALGEGVSGTLDISTDEKIATQLSGGVGVNLLSADANLTVPVSPRASVGLSARRSLADFVRTPTYNNYFDRAFRNTDLTQSTPADTVVGSDEDFYFYDIGMSANWEPSERDQVHLSLLQVFNDLRYSESALVNGSTESRVSGLTQQSVAAGLKYGRQWTPKLATRLELPVSWYRLAGINNDVESDQRLAQENEVLDLTLKLMASYTLDKTLRLSGGLQFNETGISNLEEINNPAFRRYVKEVLRTQAAFAEADFATPGGGTAVRLGLRANFFPEWQRLVPEPRLSIRQMFTEDLALEVQAEAKNQYTTQVIDLQNDFLGVEKRRWVLANSRDIPLVQSRQVSLGLVYHRQGWLLSAEGYYKTVDGIITSSQGFQNQFEYLRSAGSYRIVGLDWLAKRDWDAFAAWTSYAVGNNRYTFPQLSVSSFPNNLDIRHNLTLGGSYLWKPLELSSSVSWHSGRPFTDLDPDFPVADGRLSYQRPNSSRLGPYFRVDFSGRYQFALSNTTRCQAGFSVWNLSCYDNVLGTYFRVDESGNIKKLTELGLDLTFNTMVRIYF